MCAYAMPDLNSATNGRLSIPPRDVIRANINFDDASIRLKGIPPCAPAEGCMGWYEAQAVHVSVAEVREVRQAYAHQRTEDEPLKKGPVHKLSVEDVMAEVAAIIYHEGFPDQPTLNWLIKRVQERLQDRGKPVPQLSTLKKWLGQIFHHPDFKEDLRR